MALMTWAKVRASSSTSLRACVLVARIVPAAEDRGLEETGFNAPRGAVGLTSFSSRAAESAHARAATLPPPYQEPRLAV